MSRTRGPIVPARTVRADFFPEDGSTSSNLLSVMVLQLPESSRARQCRERSRALHGPRTESRRAPAASDLSRNGSAGATGRAVLLAELIHATSRVDDLLLAG